MKRGITGGGDWSVCHSPYRNVLSVEGLVGHMTNSQFSFGILNKEAN